MKFFKLFFLLFLFTNFLYAGVNSVKNGIEFTYEAPNASSVTVAGSFNDWNTNANPLEKGENGIWKTVIKLSPGEYQYKFVVDGNWYVDPDNLNQTEDGYGGFNSVIEIDSKGKLVIKKAKQTRQTIGIKTALNPKVLFDGRYYTSNRFINNENERYMLDKPVHDLNLGVRVKFNNEFEGYTVLNINNGAEGADMWKTHLNYKRTLLKLNTNYFSLNGFDNFGSITFNDPLHIVGDEGKYHYAFGYGYKGVYAKSNIFSISPLDFQAEVLYADQSGDDDGDIGAGRGVLWFNLRNKDELVSKVHLGYSDYSARFPLSTTSSQKNISREVDIEFAHSLQSAEWQSPMNFVFNSEYYSFENSNIDSITTKWLDGFTIYFGTKVRFPAALEVYGNYQRNKLNFEKELRKDRITIGGNFGLERLSANLELCWWKNHLPDSTVSWSDYYKYLEKTDGNGRWFQKYSDVPFEQYTLLGYKTGLIWKVGVGYKFNIGKQKFEVNWQDKIAQINFQYKPKYIENELIFNWEISRHWKFYSNTRMPYYNDSFLGLKTDFKAGEDLFVSNFSKISYYLKENIELSLGWGVNPKVINNVTDEFYDGGREEFMESVGGYASYLENNYRGLGEKIRTAEQKLMDEQRISIEAVVKF
ncbi:MAG: glycogen-binding domain-containing protein [Candidatus Cloacimonetes bacterium]|nr:glycogen-binding domain-containing protein [Candidatus Cloacimonadota bacterium]